MSVRVDIYSPLRTRLLVGVIYYSPTPPSLPDSVSDPPLPTEGFGSRE